MRAIVLLSLLAGAMAAPESRLTGPTIPTCVPQHNTHDSLLLMCQSNSISNQTWAGCEEKNFLQVPVQRVRGRDAQAWSHGQDGSCLHSCERSNCVQSIYNMAKKTFGWHFINAVVNLHRTTSGTHTAPLLATTSTSVERASPDTMSACW